MKQSTTILKETIDSFQEGDRFVIDHIGIRYIREDIVEKAIENSINAKLIAAAPELLEALQRLVDAYSDTLIEEFSHDPEKDENVMFAKKAIKKATE